MQTDPETEPSTDHRPTADRSTIRAYADAHGLTYNAVRMRIRRGTLSTEKIGGVVYVIETDRPLTDPTDRTDRPQTDPADLGSDMAEGNLRAHEDRDDLVAQLRSEVVFLRAELEARREAERELRIMLVTRALDAPRSPRRDSDDIDVESPTPSPDAPSPAPQRPWWRFWRD